MKIYDKEIYKKTESMKEIILMILVFILGYIAGCFAINNSIQEENKIEQEYVENKIGGIG